MGIRKLDNKEQKLISAKITELVELNQKAIAKGSKAFSYDWKKLDTSLTQSILEYRHILNTDEYFN